MRNRFIVFAPLVGLWDGFGFGGTEHVLIQKPFEQITSLAEFCGRSEHDQRWACWRSSDGARSRSPPICLRLPTIEARSLCTTIYRWPIGIPTTDGMAIPKLHWQ
jgi:hypothetical protein